MTAGKSLLLIASTALFGALAGGGFGIALGTFVPNYYRSVFRGGDEPHFDPVAVGLGQGITQGVVAGALIGIGVVGIMVWRETRQRK